MGNYQMITAMTDLHQMLIEHFLSFLPFFVPPLPLEMFLTDATRFRRIREETNVSEFTSYIIWNLSCTNIPFLHSSATLCLYL